MVEKNIVYSTNTNFNRSSISTSKTESIEKQDFRIHLIRLRGGKIITVIRGYKGNMKNLKDLGSFLKKKCSVGGTTKNGEIIIQGDFREKILKLLVDKGYQAKLSGG